MQAFFGFFWGKNGGKSFKVFRELEGYFIKQNTTGKFVCLNSLDVLLIRHIIILESLNLLFYYIRINLTNLHLLKG